MASPQVENGYTMLSNELLEAYAMIRISGEENQLFWFIVRKTYGFKKKDDAISLSQFSLATGINKQNVCRALSKLIIKNMIIKNDNGLITRYRIQKDYTSWKPLSKKIIKKSVIKIDNLPLSKKIHTKETITKENIYNQKFDEFWEAYPKKVGKKPALIKWNKLTIKQKDMAIIGAKYYRDEIIEKGTEDDFIKHPSTFLNKKAEYWMDYQEKRKSGLSDEELLRKHKESLKPRRY